MTKVRINKALSSAGVASRRKSEELVLQERVAVNGEVISDLSTMVDPAVDVLTLDGEPLRAEQKFYYILNKPKGYLCSNRERDDVRIVAHLFRDVRAKLFTVGRLDKDTTGLLLVTNDGDFANQVIHPRSNIEKEYLVKVNREITDEHLRKISKGTYVEGAFVKPKKVKKVRRGTVKIVVGEGKKREVRILCLNAGLKVRELTRIRIGNLRLGPLQVGRYRQMTPQDKKLIFDR